jgi:hypothetical protein
MLKFSKLTRANVEVRRHHSICWMNEDHRSQLIQLSPNWLKKGISEVALAWQQKCKQTKLKKCRNLLLPMAVVTPNPSGGIGRTAASRIKRTDSSTCGRGSTAKHPINVNEKRNIYQKESLARTHQISVGCVRRMPVVLLGICGTTPGTWPGCICHATHS